MTAKRLKWRRDSFTINLLPWARGEGRSSLREGWVCEPFAVHTSEHGIVTLTHLPTGAVIGHADYESVGNTEEEAKQFAELLLLHAGSFDWYGPRGASPNHQPPSRRTKFWKSANEVFKIVHAMTHLSAAL